LFYTINAKWNDSLFDQDPILYSGQPNAVEKLEDFEFIISPKSFFQTNTTAGRKALPGDQGICRINRQ
jgi:23S rRNA (uracil1939-C5)-methyltransferase